MQINLKAPAIAQHEIIIQAPLATVWQILTDIDRWSEWYPLVSQSKLEGSLAPGSRFRWKSGGAAIQSTIREIEPERQLSWTGKALGTQAIHIWKLEPQAEGILVKTEESFEGWLVSFFKGTMQRTLDSSLQAWLTYLKQKAEAVESSS
jgi:uncharacterized protein YndB with AHSA1/START domain